jgi:hypothetical protein
MAQRNVVSVSGAAALATSDAEPKLQNLQPGSACGAAALASSGPNPTIPGSPFYIVILNHNVKKG